MDRVYLPFYRSLMIKDQGEKDKEWQKEKLFPVEVSLLYR